MADVWLSVKLEDVFPGIKQGIEKLNKESDEVLSRFQKTLSQLQLKYDALSVAVQTTNNLLNSLSASGFYMLPLPPGSGTIVSRIATASNPPTGDYSAGLVVAVSAPDLSAVAEKYQKLMQILTTGF